MACLASPHEQPSSTNRLRKRRVYELEGGIHTTRRNTRRFRGWFPNCDDPELDSRRGPRDPLEKKVIGLSIDFGTNNSILKIVLPKNTVRSICVYNQHTHTSQGQHFDHLYSYVTSYTNCPESIHTNPTVPSIIDYDTDPRAPRCGYEADHANPKITKWFKLSLLSDDNSAVRRKADQILDQRSLNEEDVIIRFLAYLLTSAKDHATIVPGKLRWRLLAAQPMRTDGLSRERYEKCLREAARRVGIDVDDVKIRPESLAAARSCVSRIAADPGDYLCTIHDGGGGSTHFHEMLVHVYPEGGMDWKTIWAPGYLSLGGEDLKDAYLKYVQKYIIQEQNIQKVCNVEERGFMYLWDNILKVKEERLWSIDGHAKALLPPWFTLDKRFRDGLKKEVFDKVLDPVVNMPRSATTRRCLSCCLLMPTDACPVAYYRKVPTGTYVCLAMAVVYLVTLLPQLVGRTSSASTIT